MSTFARFSGLRQRAASYSTQTHTHSHRLPPTAHPKPRRQLKASHAASLAVSCSLAAYAVGSLYPPDTATLLSPRSAPPPPDPSTPSSLAYTSNLESNLQSLPLLVGLRSAPDADEWYECRPYSDFPEDRRVNSLTAGALRGPGKLALPPLLRVRKDERETVAVVHFGRGLCGHDGIIHGGLIATILDESLGRVAIMNFPEKVGVTAKLTLEYKAPTKADQFVVIRCKLVDLNGRKANVEGRIEDLNGNLLASATALFVQPRYAKLLNNKLITKAMGEPPSVAAAALEGGEPVPPTGPEKQS